MRNRIIVEAQVLAEPNKAGVEEYAEKLLSAYIQRFPEDEMLLAFFGKSGKPVELHGDNLHQKSFPLHVRIARKLNAHGYMPSLEKFFGKGVYIFPHFVWWRTGKSPAISFIHDTVYYSAPETMDDDNLQYMLKTIPRTAKHSDHIVTISESAKSDIISHLGVSEDRISVLYPGVDIAEHSKSSPKDISSVKEKYQLGDRYVLFQSTLEPRKNIINLLKAFELLPDETKRTHTLVLAGKPGWHFNQIEQQISASRKMGVKIVQTGYVASEDNVALFSGAELLVSPSFYEGFGMNLVKAMACGTPVVTSNTASMPEVVGDHGVLVDPHDPADIAKGIDNVLSNKKLQSQMIKGGKERARSFTWESSAEELANIIERLSN